MKKLSFSIQINASKAQVWQTLWNNNTYPQWTAVFHEDSQAESDWQEGSKILFTDGKGSGMVSRIARKVPNEFMSFEHLGMVKDGVEDFTSAKAEGWSGAMENYTLTQQAHTTHLEVTVEIDDSFEDYFNKTFPLAMDKIKSLAEASSHVALDDFKNNTDSQETSNNNKIFPCLWFDGQAKSAAELYCSIFPNAKITVDTPMVVNFELCGQKFMGLNGGPMFKPNPAISFFVVMETEAETEAVWQKLSHGGSVLMPYDKYPWSEKYGWLNDRFGISWQISMGKISDVGQQIAPSLLFVGNQNGKAETAINFYTKVFKNTSVTGIARYEAGEPDIEGNIKHAQFTLDNQVFMAMDSSAQHLFAFNEGVSLVVDCDNQSEVDYYWGKLTEGGEESMCAWLKDAFGVSWQIVPKLLSKLLNDPDRVKAGRAMQAMMQMRKIDTAALQKAFDGA